MVEAEREIGIRIRSYKADREHAHHISKDGQRSRAREEYASPEPRGLAEPRVCRRESSQREERAKPRARLRYVDLELVRALRNDRRATLDDIDAETLQDA